MYLVTYYYAIDFVNKLLLFCAYVRIGLYLTAGDKQIARFIIVTGKRTPPLPNTHTPMTYNRERAFLQMQRFYYITVTSSIICTCMTSTHLLHSETSGLGVFDVKHWRIVGNLFKQHIAIVGDVVACKKKKRHTKIVFRSCQLCINYW